MRRGTCPRLSLRHPGRGIEPISKGRRHTSATLIGLSPSVLASWCAPVEPARHSDIKGAVQDEPADPTGSLGQDMAEQGAEILRTLRPLHLVTKQA